MSGVAFIDEPGRLALAGETAERTAVSRRGARVVLLQTQAEGAGAQEISRILGHGLAAAGYDVHHVFLFRRTAAFDREPNTTFCARERPRSPLALARMLATLHRVLRDLKPDAILCFQHYGNIIGTLAARASGVRSVIVNRNSAKSLIPWWARTIDTALGLAGWFDGVVVNSDAVAREYDRYPTRYRRRVVQIEHGFETKQTSMGRGEALS
jgi:hypothetical protein